MIEMDTPGHAEALQAFAETLKQNNLPATVPVGRDVVGFAQTSGAVAVAVRRDIRRVLNAVKALAQAAGEGWYYRFPVKNRRTGKTDWIEGPSIKLANNLAREYGNCEVDTRVVDNGESWIIYARFIDLESGFVMTRPFQQSKGASKLGGDDDARRLDVALQIGASKAIRNVIVASLQTYAEEAFAAAKNSLVARIGSDLPRHRDSTIRRLAEVVDIGRVERVIGRSAADWLAPDVARIIAMMRAVNDGMASIDETFPPILATTAQQQPKSAGPKAAGRNAPDEPAGKMRDSKPESATRRTKTTEPRRAAEKAAETDLVAEPFPAGDSGDAGPAVSQHGAGAEPAVPQHIQALVDRIASDLDSCETCGDVEAVAALFADQIEILREQAPAAYDMLQGAIDAARERVA